MQFRCWAATVKRVTTPAKPGYPQYYQTLRVLEGSDDCKPDRRPFFVLPAERRIEKESAYACLLIRVQEMWQQFRGSEVHEPDRQRDLLPGMWITADLPADQ